MNIADMFQSQNGVQLMVKIQSINKMKKLCLAMIILASGVLTSCTKHTDQKIVNEVLMPTISVRKDIGTAD